MAQDGATLAESINFIQEARAYQNMICDEDQQMAKGVRDIGWRWFREHIRDVEVIERKSGNRLLGRKAHIILDTVVDDKKKGNEKYASIDTGWIEYHGWDKEKHHWEIALANYIYEVAEANIGKDVSVLKHVWPGDGMNKYRKIINIRPIYSSSDTPDDDDGEEEDAPDETPDYSEKDVRKVFKARSFDYTDDDVDVILDILEDEFDDEESLEDVADHLDKKANDMIVSKEAKKALRDDDFLGYLTLLIMDNVEPAF